MGRIPAVWRPRTMMITPPIMPSSRLYAWSVAPTRVAAAPSAMKTEEKPRTKTRLVRPTRAESPRGASAPRSSAMFTPLMKER